MKLNINSLVNTAIRVNVQWCDGSQQFKFQNNITYSGTDLLVRSFIHNTPSNLKYLYCFFNSRGGDGLSFPGGDKKRTTRETFLQDAVSGVEGTSHGCFWVPLSTPTTTSTSGVYYSDNRIDFTFVIPSSAASDNENKVGNLEVENSEIRAIGLASAQHNTDRTQDLIFSIIDIPEAENPNARASNESFIIPASGQVSIDYTLTFTA